MDIDTAVQISVTAQEVRITTLVRVPDFQHLHAGWVLGGGKQGFVVPHVGTKEIAKKIVAQCKYPPIGHRSVTGAQPMLDFQIYPMGEATQAVNSATFLVIILETPLIIFNAHEIAAIPAWMHC
jgi:2-keto-3-deoxy-L-rhamnonate aldolase RhmA